MSKSPPTEPAFELVLSDIQLENLGRFTAIWSQVDHMLFQAINLTVGIQGIGLLALIEGTTTGQRLAMLRRLIPQMKTEEAKSKAEDACSALGRLLDKRNHIMHGVWGLNWDTATDKLHPACAYEKAKESPLYATQLEDMCERAAKISWKMLDLLHSLTPGVGKPNGVPVRFMFAAGPPPGRPAPEWRPQPARRSSPANPDPDSAK